MIKYNNKFFMCDECPICEDVERRIRIAKEGGYKPQLEYCSCDKVDGPFYAGGYCEDAFEESPCWRDEGQRRTGRAYRRAMTAKRKKDLMTIVGSHYKPHVGWVDWDWIDGVWQQTGQYVKFPSSSRKERWLKKYCNRRVRRSKGSYRGGEYKKLSEYWWIMY